MKVLDEYVINLLTVAIFHQYSEEGGLYSLVVEKEKMYLVKMSPLAIIKHSIQFYGHTFEGAEKAAKAALGNIQMVPVKISGKLGIYWFPSKSATHEDCSWFSAQYVENNLPVSKKKLNVIFEGGFEAVIDSSCASFERKLSRARNYQKLMDSRTNNTTFFTYAETPASCQIVRDPVRNHFMVEGWGEDLELEP